LKTFQTKLRVRPLAVSHCYPLDGGRLRGSQFQDLRVVLPDWPNTRKLRMTINGQTIKTRYRPRETGGELCIKNIPELKKGAKCVNIIGHDEAGSKYVYSFLFWLQ